MGKLIPRILKELISPGNHLIIFFVILLLALCTGYCAGHFFKGNKNAKLIETYAEKIIEHETGITVNFYEAEEEVEPIIPIIEFRYPTYEMDFKREMKPDSSVKN
jgi:hypothetical protein